MRPANSLWITAFVVALVWRIEVELRGWHGLTWLGYNHLSIPIGGLLFLTWIRLVTKSDRRSLAIIGWAALWGVIAWFILDYAASAYFVGGPTAITYEMMLGSLFDHVHWLSPLVWCASILILYGGYSLVFNVPPLVWFTGPVLWIGSWHLGLMVITVIPERGYHDLIHSLKTGWMIPFCVVAAGLPILTLKPKAMGIP